VITNTAGTTLFGAGDHGVDVLRAGVSYKFGDPATAVPVRYAKAPLLAPSSGWAGFYLGGHAGYGSHDDDFTEVIDFTSGGQTGGIKSRGWLGGGHAGHNWQYGRIVAGLEADFSFADIDGASRPVTQFTLGEIRTDTPGDTIKYLATARTRLGWLPGDSVMLYATAGPAWARMERMLTRTFDGAGGFRNDVQTAPTDRFGGVVWRRRRMDAIWSELDRPGRISPLRFRQGSRHYDHGHKPPGHHCGVRASGTSDRRYRARGNLL
jgi:outer membrane immunogenic protein